MSRKLIVTEICGVKGEPEAGKSLLFYRLQVYAAQSRGMRDKKFTEDLHFFEILGQIYASILCGCAQA